MAMQRKYRVKGMARNNEQEGRASITTDEKLERGPGKNAVSKRRKTGQER